TSVAAWVRRTEPLGAIRLPQAAAGTAWVRAAASEAKPAADSSLRSMARPPCRVETSYLRRDSRQKVPVSRGAPAYSDASMGQYFGGKPPATSPHQSQVLAVQPPKRTDKTAVERIVAQLQSGGHLSQLDRSRTVVNLMLPAGTVLSDSGGAQKRPGLDEEAADSLHGLGGFHGSLHLGGGVTYYAVGVFSQRLNGGQENGIVAFDEPWKNVVATFYHELNEARTDADVEDAIRAGDDPKADALLGWT